jgi:protein farnesyltransferase subunit beta
MSSQNPSAERTPGTAASRIEELTDDEVMVPTDTEQIFSSTASSSPFIPLLFTSLPEIQDSLVTETSEIQDATVEQCLPLLAEPGNDLNIFGISQLDRAKHLRYLKRMLEGPFPPQFVAADASRPWMVYWALTALYLLGEDTTAYRDR